MFETVSDLATGYSCPACATVGMRDYSVVVWDGDEPVNQHSFDYCRSCGWCLDCDLFGDAHHDDCPVHGSRARDGAYESWL